MIYDFIVTTFEASLQLARKCSEQKLFIHTHLIWYVNGLFVFKLQFYL